MRCGLSSRSWKTTKPWQLVVQQCRSHYQWSLDCILHHALYLHLVLMLSGMSCTGATLYIKFCGNTIHSLTLHGLCRSTPVEVLHTVLLGPYKYLLGKAMKSFSPRQKQEVLARILSFNHSGFVTRLTSNVTRYSQSFVGRDFKLWAQMAPFILKPYMTAGDLELWIALSDVCYSHACILTHTYTCLLNV